MVGDRGFGRDRALLVVQFRPAVVISAILPVVGAWGARGQPLGGGRRQQRVQLLELGDRSARAGGTDQGEDEQGQQIPHPAVLFQVRTITSG